MLAICLLALVETTDAAEATSLPQNGKIAFTSFHVQDQDYGIYTVDPDGSSLRQLTSMEEGDHLPAWSPDGTKIAFGHDGPIWVMDADGSNLRRLTPNRSDVPYGAPVWSPDGTKLAFMGFIESELPFGDVYTMDVDGSNITNVTKSPGVLQGGIDFSPDGSQICLSGLSGEAEIFVMNVDGSNITRLTTERDHAMQCSWSPDATKIAYTVEPYGIGGPVQSDAEVYVMNADGSGRTQLTNTPESGEPGAGSWSPKWSPDGAKIAFTSDRGSRDGNSDIYTMGTDGSDVARVTNLSGDEQGPDWQPLPRTTVDQPDTGGPSLLLVASALLFCGGVVFYAGLKRSL
jgi:Tol biopolymer transport system component